ncbi:translocation/assembly module TamB domain-containing protein [Pseudomonas matsuisoli]|uniref:Translocation/assembly module TamB n=1 Tax=Pseudomonas matsuisoli TaxID=1515666 RepID=A0A917UUA6_9PSED|nr:translocation/assembly module TamB domain-containing protein [Pseudomonas matsuisoli]GGJ86044.1 translocation/assembly module TamB [Pseudomonas matsuisoli]
MRVLKWSGVALLALVTLLVLMLAVLLGTQSGSRWALGQVPGLSLDGFQGRLGGSWHADRLIWQQGVQKVELEQPAFSWSPTCLFRLTLCIERIAATTIHLDFPPTDEPAEPSGPLELPDIGLPIGLEIGELDIGQVFFNGGEQLVSATLRAHWNEQGLRIEQLTAKREDLDATLQATLTPAGQWPLALIGKVDLAGVDDQPWSIDLDLTGNVKDELRLDAKSQGYLDGNLKAWVNALDERLPARLRLTASGFKAAPSLPDTLTLNDLELTADGTLAEGYRILGTSLLPGQGGPVKLALDGRVDAKGARVEALELLADGQRYLRLNGTADWQNAIAADARIDWQDFPWRSLYPEIEEPPVSLRRFQGEIAYRDGAYQGQFSSDLDGPAGAFSLASPIQGDLQQVSLPALNLKAGQGTLDGRLAVGFAEGISWDTDLALSKFDPSYWLAELPGQLAGPIRSKGSINNGVIAADADIDIRGQLRTQQARLSLAATGQGERWSIANLALLVGDNRVEGQGSLEGQLKGQLQLALNNLGQLWPGLTGQVKGNVTASGTLEKPQGTLSLDGTRVGLGDNRVSGIALTARLDGNQQATISLDANRIALGETDLGNLSVTGQGNAQSQRAELSLDGPLLQTGLALNGTLKEGNWRGQLSRGDISSNDMDWRLQQPASLERLASGQFTLGKHCWAYADATLCADDQRLTPDTSLRMRLRQFPLEILAKWLPDDFAWEGQLNADVNLDLPEAGPKGTLSVDAGSGKLRVRDGDTWHDFPYSRLAITSQLSPQRVDTDLNFDGGPLGQLDVTAQIDPRPADKPIEGQFALRGLDLSVGRPFAPMVEQLEGQLNGSGTLAGTLQSPLVNGQLCLSNGRVAGSELPTQVEALEMTVDVAGQSLKLDGNWRSGEAGRGQIAGTLDWNDGTNVDVRVRGTKLPVNVQPYAELEVEPDLQIGLAGDRLALSGTVNVPRGAIQIRELPPSTVQVSSDTVIVGQEREDAKTALQMAMDIDVNVGQDRLTFSAFGLNADIAGQMHVGDNLDARGELNLNNGRFRSYGQRLTVRRARLLFTGPIDQPFLDVEAIRVVDDVTAGIRLTGFAAAPQTEVFSEPAMGQEQALSYLILGRPLSTGQEDNNLLAQAALGLGLAGSSSFTGGVAQSLGIENFQLDTEGTGNTTSVVASGELTERLTLRYGVGVFEPANTIALRYALTKRVYVEAASGLASSLDIFYKRDF